MLGKLSMLKVFTCRYSVVTFKVKTHFHKLANLSRREALQFHSLAKQVNFEKMEIKILPALQDNYMYLIIDKGTKEAAIVDPVEPETVVNAVNHEHVKLTTILITHHHWDHAGGNKKLLTLLPNLEVVGGDERIDGLTKKVQDQDIVKVGELEVNCIYTPCHTKGHICYFIKADNEPPVVITGDTLFFAGCGRFFEGNAEEMYSALIKKLGSLPENTRVFCGHEYTVKNLQFASIVDPNNEHIKKKLEWAELKRKNKEPTIPSTIGEEKLINPFMRVHNDEIQRFTGQADPIDAMKVLRNKKDSF